MTVYLPQRKILEKISGSGSSEKRFFLKIILLLTVRLIHEFFGNFANEFFVDLKTILNDIKIHNCYRGGFFRTKYLIR